LNYWKNSKFSEEISRKEKIIKERLENLKDSFPDEISEIRGRGFLYGIALKTEGNGSLVSAACFENNLLVETSGANSDVVKLLPPLTISDDDLIKGLDILEECMSVIQDQVMV